MTAKEIFFKTLQFGWIKLGLGLLNILIAVLLFAILMGISVLFNSDGVVAIMFFIWLGLIGVVNFFLNHYIGYLVKAGHGGRNHDGISNRHMCLPNPSRWEKTMVKERFVSSNVYFRLSKTCGGFH